MLPWYAWAGIGIGGAAVVVCGALATVIAFVEIYDYRRDRERERQVEDRATGQRLDELDLELAKILGAQIGVELEEIWRLS